MTADDFRRIATSLPGAIEGAHMGHPDFRANGRIFASLHAGDATAMVKLTPEEQGEYIRQDPDVFSPAAGAWGRGGSTIVTLAAARAAIVRPALTRAHELVMALPAPRSARTATSSARTTSRAAASRRAAEPEPAATSSPSSRPASGPRAASPRPRRTRGSRSDR